jgi:hypothetical protein
MKAFAAVNIGNAFLPENSVFRGEGGTIGNLVSEFLPLLYLTAGILTVLYFLFGAIQYIYSGGDPKAKESAQKKIQYAVLGFALVALSFLIVQFFGRLVHIGPTREVKICTHTCPAPNPQTDPDYLRRQQTNPLLPPLCTTTYPQGPCQTNDCTYYCYKI